MSFNPSVNIYRFFCEISKLFYSVPQKFVHDFRKSTKHLSKYSKISCKLNFNLVNFSF